MSKFLSHFVTSFKSVRTEFWTTYGEKVLLVFYNVPFSIIIQSEKGFSGMPPVFGLFFLAQMLFHLFPRQYFAPSTRVLCSKYPGTLRQVPGASPQGTLAHGAWSLAVWRAPSRVRPHSRRGGMSLSGQFRCHLGKPLRRIRSVYRILFAYFATSNGKDLKE